MLVTCPGCHGVKKLDILVKVKKDGTRVTKKENCRNCNGTGLVQKKQARKSHIPVQLNGEAQRYERWIMQVRILSRGRCKLE